MIFSLLTRSTTTKVLLNSTKPFKSSIFTTQRMSSSTTTTVTSPWSQKASPYPIVRRDEEFTETFKSLESKGEVKVKDPYHYLTVPSTSEETQQFVTAQGEYTSNYLLRNKVNAEKYKTKLTENWNYSKFSCPALKGDDNYYFTYNSGLQSQSSIYRFHRDKVNQVIEDGQPGGELFFDPNLLSTDGSVSRSSSSFSEDGKYFAYALSRSGSDWTNIYVRLTASPHLPTQTIGQDEGRLPDDVLNFVKFSSISWTQDSKGFFYQRFPARVEHSVAEDAAGTEINSDEGAMIYYHRIGTKQDQDILVMKDDVNPGWMFGAGATEDGRYVTMSFSKDTGRSNLLWIADLNESEIGENMKWKKVVNEWGEYFAEMGNDGSKFYFYTNANDSPNYKIVTYDLENPSAGFIDLIPHRPEALLSSYHLTNKASLLLVYSIDVKDELYLYSLESGKQIKRLAEGMTGSLDQIAGRREDVEFWYSVSGFTTPGTVIRYQFLQEKDKVGEGKEEVYRVAKVKGIDPNDFITEQVFYTSKDGVTKIPMFITRPVGVELNMDNPAILYGYGGFSASMTPFFSPSLLTWIKHYKGILAVANIRGGGEYGEEWHLAGVKSKKQNVFDDFEYAARYLMKEGYAGEKKVAISGGSNGGLLVGACLNQHPELYGAAIADVGVLDMLRFHRYTVGKFWTSDYGCSDNPEDFDYLFKYSPLHNVDSNKIYPPAMFLTSDHDDRVVPLHSFKHAAELQHQLKDNPNPLLLRVDAKAGHGAGKSTEKKIEEAVDKYGFVAHSLGLKFYD